MIKINKQEKTILSASLVVAAVMVAAPRLFLRPALANTVGSCSGKQSCSSEPCKFNGKFAGTYVDCCSGSNVVTAAVYSYEIYNRLRSGACDMSERMGFCNLLSNFTDKRDSQGRLIPCTSGGWG